MSGSERNLTTTECVINLHAYNATMLHITQLSLLARFLPFTRTLWGRERCLIPIARRCSAGLWGGRNRGHRPIYIRKNSAKL